MPENNEIVMILLVDLTFWVEFVIAESIEDVGRVNFSTLVGLIFLGGRLFYCFNLALSSNCSNLLQQLFGRAKPIAYLHSRALCQEWVEYRTQIGIFVNL